MSPPKERPAAESILGDLPGAAVLVVIISGGIEGSRVFRQSRMLAFSKTSADLK